MMRNAPRVLLVASLALPAVAQSQPVDPKLTGLIVAVRSLPGQAVEPLLNGRTGWHRLIC